MASPIINIDGLNDMIKGFKDLGEQAQKNRIIGGKLVANEYKNDVQDRAPHKKGNYRTSIHAEGPIEDAVFLVGTDNIAAKQHEFGGIIKAKNGPYLVFQIDGKWVMTKQVSQPPYPHFRPALDENKEKYNQMMLEALFG